MDDGERNVKLNEPLARWGALFEPFGAGSSFFACQILHHRL